MAQNLAELKEELYKSFNDARSRATAAHHYDTYGYPEQAKIEMLALQAAAETAKAIAKVEHEIADQSSSGAKAIVKPVAPQNHSA